MPAPLRIGLTGGIGSGKSTVCELFTRYKIPVIDADKIAHELLQPEQEGYRKIVNLFGNDIVKDTGELDRSLIRNMIFSDESLKTALEDILHPVIFDEIRKRVLQVQSDYCIISIPLLVESNCRDLVDRILVVDAPVEIRVERAARRDNTTPEEIRKIVASQSKPDERLAIADDIINNDGDINKLHEQVNNLHNLYKKLAGELRY